MIIPSNQTIFYGSETHNGQNVFTVKHMRKRDLRRLRLERVQASLPVEALSMQAVEAPACQGKHRLLNPRAAPAEGGLEGKAALSNCVPWRGDQRHRDVIAGEPRLFNLSS